VQPVQARRHFGGVRLHDDVLVRHWRPSTCVRIRRSYLLCCDLKLQISRLTTAKTDYTPPRHGAVNVSNQHCRCHSAFCACCICACENCWR